MATIDFEFRNQIIQSDIGSTLAYCYQCATCSGACPVAQVTLFFRCCLPIRELNTGKGADSGSYGRQTVVATAHPRSGERSYGSC